VSQLFGPHPSAAHPNEDLWPVQGSSGLLFGFLCSSDGPFRGEPFGSLCLLCLPHVTQTYLLTLDVFTLTHFPIDHATLLETICNRSQQQLTKTDEIFRQQNDRQTLSESLAAMKGRDKRESKRFLRYVVVRSATLLFL
jgi:hypothetical protein